MKIINSEIIVSKTDKLSSEYIETFLISQNIDFLRWAIVNHDEKNFVLNVSHKIKNNFK